MTVASEAISERLNHLVRLEIRVLGRPVPAFSACGVVGFAAAVVVASGLARGQGLSVGVILLLALVAAGTYVVVAGVGSDVDGTTRLVDYHHQIAITTATAGTLYLAGEPILAYLDIVAPALGVFLACGRIGCLLVGCCHGRAAAVGVSYGKAHVHAGFPAYLAGVRLFPIQAVESVRVLAVALMAVAVSAGAPPGAGAAWYFAAYATGRFFIEYARGDGARRYAMGLSEAQWTSVLLLAALVGAEHAGLVPWSPVHVIAVVLVAAVAATSAVVRTLCRHSERVLLEPPHLEEFAMTIDHVSRRAAESATRGEW